MEEGQKLCEICDAPASRQISDRNGKEVITCEDCRYPAMIYLMNQGDLDGFVEANRAPKA